MTKVGIIGMNEGNGHPYSYSAIFNGFDSYELDKRCPYELIRTYLRDDHRNENNIENARVTHIWTQSDQLSENVAKVSLIPNIVSDYREMIGEVDAVILARDDPWRHWEMAEPFIRHGVPIFIDKQLTSTKEELDLLLSVAGPDYPLMAGSPIRFSRDVLRLKDSIYLQKVRSIHGMSRVNWMRYGHHLFEGVAVLWGLDIQSVRSLNGQEGHDIIQIQYKNGLNVILEFVNNIALPIQFTCFSEENESYMVCFDDFFNCFKRMLESFINLVEKGEKQISLQEIEGIARIILAGEISKQTNGARISPTTLEAIR